MRRLVSVGIRGGRTDVKFDGRLLTGSPALTPDKIAELRQPAAEGGLKAVLARDFGISRATVYTYLQDDDETDLIGVTPARPAD